MHQVREKVQSTGAPTPGRKAGWRIGSALETPAFGGRGGEGGAGVGHSDTVTGTVGGATGTVGGVTGTGVTGTVGGGDS